MATLGKIRKHGVLLLIVVGLAMLAFIVGDFLSSSNSYFHRQQELVGEVEGVEINIRAYEAAREQLTEVYKIETGRNDFDEDMSSYIQNQVWQMMVSQHAMEAQAEKIGMTVTNDELSELCIGANPHQIVRSLRVARDQSGNFSQYSLIGFINAIAEDSDDAQQQEMIEQYRKYWQYVENMVRVNYLQEKYQALFAGCLQVNSLEAEYAANAKQQTVAAQYVCKPYYAVADSLVTVSDKDIKARYNKFKKLYKQEPNRSISYVQFPIVPSEADYNAAKEALEALAEDFANTDDIMTLVNINSDESYDGRHLSLNDVPEEYKEFASTAKAGAVTELAFNEATATWSMARLVETGYSRPDSVELKAISPVEGQEDQELGWFGEYDLTRAANKELAEKAFTAKKGDRITVTLGLNEQTFEVMNISAATPKVKLAILSRTVIASSQTRANLYNEAKQFVVENNTEEKFEEAAADKNLRPTTLYASTDKVDQLKASRPIIRWAFKAKEGEVSDVFECGEVLVVAALTDINESEYRTLEDVQGELRYTLLNEKKADYLVAQLGGVTTLEAAAETFGVGVQEAEGINFASARFGLGNEPAAVAAALALNEGELSTPVKGNMGVYMLMGGAHETAEAEADAEAEKAALGMRMRQTAGRLMNLVMQEANIVDHRINFK